MLLEPTIQWILRESELMCVNLDLGPGEKRVIAMFQDKSSFHVNELKKTTWYVLWVLWNTIFMFVNRMRPEQQKLIKKGCGQIIHVSDFVKEENGHLIICNQDGIMIRDVWCITYPGAAGDPWWDHTQLLTQVNNAISIFEEAHPNCVSLFIFDQLFAHVSLGPDTLHAFDMNKSNGGKQRKQKDTVIPMNNCYVEFYGKPQKMTTETGEAKGLQ